MSCFGVGSLFNMGGGGTGGNKLCVYLAGESAIVNETGGLYNNNINYHLIICGKGNKKEVVVQILR